MSSMDAVHSTPAARGTNERPFIAGFPATLSRIDVGAEAIALWEVADLERHVDRTALLAGDDPPEPPYWAHRWTGAAVLAEAVPRGARSAVELGCGLGLPGLVAARRGARVTFVDRVVAPLAFVRASAAAGAGRRPPGRSQLGRVRPKGIARSLPSVTSRGWR